MMIETGIQTECQYEGSGVSRSRWKFTAAESKSTDEDDEDQTDEDDNEDDEDE